MSLHILTLPIRFARQPDPDYLFPVSALEIIQQIRELPEEERQKVKIFLGENLEEGQLPAAEIERLVQLMIDAKDPAEAKRLEDEIVRGFYGNVPHA